MRILVSNDDGIYSPGIAVLASVASEFGELCVVAPDVERSSAGHSITASRPLSFRRTRLEGLTAFRVNGTPADFFVPPPDSHHLSILGHYYMAMTLYSSIYRRPVERAPLSFTTPQGTQAGFVSQENATKLQKLAWDAVREFYEKPPAPRSMASCRADVTRLGCEKGDCERKVSEVFAD